MFFFCTYFDSRYLAKGLAMYRSLARHAAPFRLWVLCLDELVHDVLKRLALPGMELIALTDFERGDAKLLEAKKDRSRVEYYFTCTPSLPLYIFNRYPEVDNVTYLDADIFFYSSPRPIFDEFAGNSILIVGHRFSPSLKDLAVAGIYNVSFISFRKDRNALECLDRWRGQCLAWCHDRADGGRFADQKYLDDWPARCSGVRVLRHNGANLAPWNIDNYAITYENGAVLVDSDPLIFFHFHGLRQVNRWAYEPFITGYSGRMTAVLKRHVFAPYLSELHAASAHVAPFLEGARPLDSTRYTNQSLSVLRSMKKIMKGEFLAVVGGKVV